MRETEARMTVEEGESVSEVFRVFKGAVTTVAAEVIGYRAMRSQRKGITWRTDEIKETIERNRKAYKKMLQRIMEEDMKVRRKTEYKLLNGKVKVLVKESNRKVDKEFGIKLSENGMRWLSY